MVYVGYSWQLCGLCARLNLVSPVSITAGALLFLLQRVFVCLGRNKGILIQAAEVRYHVD